jgi:hypothetical protein
MEIEISRYKSHNLETRKKLQALDVRVHVDEVSLRRYRATLRHRGRDLYHYNDSWDGGYRVAEYDGDTSDQAIDRVIDNLCHPQNGDKLYLNNWYGLRGLEDGKPTENARMFNILLLLNCAILTAFIYHVYVNNR